MYPKKLKLKYIEKSLNIINKILINYNKILK